MVAGLHRWMLAGALAVGGLALPAASAHATRDGPAFEPAPPWSFSISGANGAAYLHAGNGTANASAETQQEWDAGGYETYAVDITRPNGSFYNVEFATPYGSNRHFAPGYYPWAQDAGGPPSKGRPGISIWGGSNPCGGSSGSFEVRGIARGAKGDITRLDIVFTRYCGGYGSGDVDIGELKIGYPQTAYEVSPDEVAWPWTTVYPGQSAEDHPVHIRLTSGTAVTVSRPYVTGPDAADFPIRKQHCTGTLTATGCTIWVGFTPTARGPRHAELIVPTSAGATSVSLDGTGGLGTSNWSITYNSGVPPQTHKLVMGSVSAGDPQQVRTQALQPQPDGTYLLWDAEFRLEDGSQLKVGTTYHWSSNLYPFVMSISQGDGACEINSGSVTPTDLAYLGPDHLLDRMDAQFDVTCDGFLSAVSAEMRFHERSDITPPGPVTGLEAVRNEGRVTLTWKNPPDSDLAGVIIRWYRSAHAPGAWFTGNPVYQGTGSSASFMAPATKPVSVTAWTYDTTGNVGAGTSAHLP